MKHLKDRLAYALAKREKSQAELSRAVKATEAAISLWLSGSTKSIRMKTLVLVASFLGCNLQWLASGNGPSGLESEFDEDDTGMARPGVGLNVLSSEEIELVGYFRQSSSEQRTGILGAAFGIFYKPKSKPVSGNPDDDNRATSPPLLRH